MFIDGEIRSLERIFHPLLGGLCVGLRGWVAVYGIKGHKLGEVLLDTVPLLFDARAHRVRRYLCCSYMVAHASQF